MLLAATFLICAFSCGAQLPPDGPGVPYYDEHGSNAEFGPLLPPNGAPNNYEKTPEMDEEFLHPTTCLLCCKNKVPKYKSTLCKNPKICNSKQCQRYMAKARTPTNERQLAAAIARNARTREALVPQESAYCRKLHPQYRDVVMYPASDDPCSFVCFSENNPLVSTHKTPNGWTCNGNPNKVCWDNECRERAGPVEDQLCVNAAAKTATETSRNIKALVKLYCQIVCQDDSSDVVWYLRRTDNPDCDPPDWLPHGMDF